MKKFYLLLAAVIFMSVQSLANGDETICRDNIYYRFLSHNPPEVAITYKGSSYQDYNEYTGDVVIPPYVYVGDTPYSVTCIGWCAFRDCVDLISVTIPNSVINIESDSHNYGGAFQNCSSLTSVTIGNSVTNIGDSAFSGCASLDSIMIPNSVTQIGEYAFSGCIRLGSVNIPNSVSRIERGTFSGCASLTSITIPNSIVYIASNAYMNCYGLNSVHYDGSIEEWCGLCFGDDNSNPLYFGHDLYIDNQLVTDLVIPDSVTSIGNYAFIGCGMTSLTVPCSVANTGKEAFSKCINLSNVNWNAKNLTNFSGCENINNVIIGDSVQTIADEAFEKCENLTSLTIGKSVTSIGAEAFGECFNISSVYYTGDIAGWCRIDFADHISNPLSHASNFYINNNLVTDIVIPNQVDSIKQYAFFNLASLKSVRIGNSVTSIGDGSFQNCSNLTSLTIGDSVTSIGKNSFSYCSGLPSVAFNDALKSIGDYSFYSCSNLKSVKIPNSVTYIGERAFVDCIGITSAIIGNSVTSIGMEAFKDCTGMTYVIIGNSVTNMVGLSFSGCVNLETVIWNAVNLLNSSESHGPFYGCSNIKTVIIGDMVNSIPDLAFYGNATITSITIGKSVRRIGVGAFSCGNNPSITSEAMVPPICNGYSFYGVPTDIPVYVPCGCGDAYRTSPIWYSFTNITEMSCDVQISLSAFPAEGGTVSGDGHFNTGDNVSVTATANPGYHFVNWTKDGYEVSTDATYTFTAISSRNLVANFSNGTGIEEENIHDFAIYPNPTSGIVIIDVEDVQHVEIIDINGKVINRIGKANAIDLSNLNKGIYFLRIILPQGNTIRRVVKI